MCTIYVWLEGHSSSGYDTQARYSDMHCSKLFRIFYCNVSMMLWSPFLWSFRWCCYHLFCDQHFDDAVITFSVINISMTLWSPFLAWWRWSQHHRNVAIKDSEQFWAVHVQISSWYMCTICCCNHSKSKPDHYRVTNNENWPMFKFL